MPSSRRLLQEQLPTQSSRCSEDNYCTPEVSHSTTNGATAHFMYQIRISSAKGCPERSRMRKPSVSNAFRYTHGQTNSCTSSDVAAMATYGTSALRPLDGREDQEGEAVSDGRRQSARTYRQRDNAQVVTGPHNRFPRRISRAAEALLLRHRTFCGEFFIEWSPPQRKKRYLANQSIAGNRRRERRTDGLRTGATEQKMDSERTCHT